jgi:hypothetical protein
MIVRDLLGEQCMVRGIEREQAHRVTRVLQLLHQRFGVQ